jgi:hypothetical protein
MPKTQLQWENSMKMCLKYIVMVIMLSATVRRSQTVLLILEKQNRGKIKQHE